MADLSNQATKELLELSSLTGNTINTIQKVAEDGKFDPLGSDLSPIVNWLLGSVAGVKGAGEAFGAEITNATVADLLANEQAFEKELQLAIPIQKHNFTRIYGGILSAVNEIKRQGIEEGRKAILKELAAGVSLELLYAAEVGE